MKRVRDEQGQASIMIGMMIMTFILFFAFVINTGMLVNAKINLQNAADLAAYSGAATQARQLNHISYLNYEMRRQYKKFLFRYYVMGNMAQAPFPRNAGGSGKTAPRWSPEGRTDYRVPTVCMMYNANDNFCQLAALPHIEIPPSNQLDAINETLRTQLLQIENIRRANCTNIGITNAMTLKLWLWNTDPSLENLQAGLGQEQLQAVNTIRGLAFGLGLIPRELILRQRINTLNEYVNEPAHKSVMVEQINAMKNDVNSAAKERTINAFMSAYYTLGEHAFEGGNIVMDELTPNTLLTLNDIKTRFDTYAIQFNVTNDPANPADCQPVVHAEVLQNDATLGVYKDPSVMTYYAIKLKAKAKVMFSPWGDMELKAYAAAQPFGSRIGPALTGDDFVRTDVELGLQPPAGSNNLLFTHKIPNLPIRADDSTDAGNGWDTQQALGAFYQKFSLPSQNGNLPTIDQAALQRAYHAAMVPNPYEAEKYNILNDTSNDPFVRNFDKDGKYAFWAPIISPDKVSQAQDLIRGMVEELLADDPSASARFKESIQNELAAYFSKLHDGRGENGESFNIVRLDDPVNTREAGPPQAISLAGGLSMTDPRVIRSSWNAVLNGSFQQAGRVGYSVKFVSFDSLTANRGSTDGRNTWSNSLAPDADADSDLPWLKH